MRILICDDDERALNSLKEMTEDILKQHMGQNDIYVETFVTSYDLTEYLEEKGAYVDAVILDIELNDADGINGIDLAARIQSEYSYIHIIFCTGYLKYSENVFRVNPLYSIYKPVTLERLENVIEKLIKEAERKRTKYITIKLYKKIQHIMTDTIKYAEINDRHVNIYTDIGMYEAIESIDKIGERLGINFIRCHKSYIINLDKMRKLEQNKMILEDGTEVAVSRRYRTKVKERIAEILK